MIQDFFLLYKILPVHISTSIKNILRYIKLLNKIILGSVQFKWFYNCEVGYLTITSIGSAKPQSFNISLGLMMTAVCVSWHTTHFSYAAVYVNLNTPSQDGPWKTDL